MKRKLLFPLAFLIVFICISVFSCTKDGTTVLQQRPLAAPSPAPLHYDTITTLAAFNRSAPAIWAHHGIYTQVTWETSTDAEYENDGENAPTPDVVCSENFAGSARSAAKTSYASVSYGTYASINAMRAVLQTDAYMKSLGITNSSPRVSEENRNRNITTSYLYAIARESDNDFHMIIGDAVSTADNLLNCEASGLPPSSQSSYTAINAVRTYLKTYFGTDFCGQSGYTKFTPAIPVTLLKGSLFFDIDHAAGTVGPTGLRPNTAWEMHPIHDIAF